ncbi:MAG: hypothetical protein IKU37_08955 [Candidatus Gastranaerophilales bacterium]|nr:hypothetical protein [Candidatus Gastranaerophilales bacterium]
MALTDVGATPVVQTSSGYGDGFGGSWVWAFLIFALLGNGSYGFGNRGFVGMDNAVFGAQQFGQLDNGIRAVQNGIADATFALNNSVKDGFYATQTAIQGVNTNLGNALCSTTYELASKINGVGTQMQACCCDIQRAIDGVNFNSERNTSAIIQNATANTQRILDYLNCKELADKNQTIFEMSQKAQTAEIIASMKPVAPVPAYIQPSPYEAYRVSNYSGCCSNNGYAFV